jgi:APA family basic amino acid/polyamine antiporter
LLASLVICTLFYLLVAGGAIGAYGAQPVYGAHGEVLAAGSRALTARCTALGGPQPLVCSREALAHVLRQVGHPVVGNVLGLAAGFALPSVVLLMMFGQTRVFFVMARDGLLPKALSAVHPRFDTPHVVTMITGVGVAFAAAFLPVGKLADYSNSGTLFAFAVVSVAVMVLRFTAKDRRRPFRTPLLFVVAPLSIFGCVVLFISLSIEAKLLFPIWAAIGLVFYFSYGFWRSNVRRGVVEA